MFALASASLIFDAQGNTGCCEIFLHRVRPCSLCCKRTINLLVLLLKDFLTLIHLLGF